MEADTISKNGRSLKNQMKVFFITITVGIIVAFAACDNSVPGQDDAGKIAKAKLDSIHGKFRIDFENAKTKPNPMSTAVNSRFNENGGDQAKNVTDSIEAAEPTADYFISFDKPEYNMENMLVWKNTCVAAKQQQKIVDNLVNGK